MRDSSKSHQPVYGRVTLMTSPLRRKRQTTARSTSPATIPKWTLFVVAGLLVGLSAELRPVVAAADDPAANPPAVKAASYSTGKAGGRLKWTGRQTDPAITPTQYVEPDPDGEPLRRARRPGFAAEHANVEQVVGRPKATKTPRRPRSWATRCRRRPRPEGEGTETVAHRSDIDSAASHSRRELPFAERAETDRRIEDRHRAAAAAAELDGRESGLPRDCPLGNGVFPGRSFAPITYTWTASALCHKPLYFEDVQLERYGHMAGPWLQPFASAANFFSDVPDFALQDGPGIAERVHLHARLLSAGQLWPYLFDPLPISVRGLFFESGAGVGLRVASILRAAQGVRTTTAGKSRRLAFLGWSHQSSRCVFRGTATAIVDNTPVFSCAKSCRTSRRILRCLRRTSRNHPSRGPCQDG